MQPNCFGFQAFLSLVVASNRREYSTSAPQSICYSDNSTRLYLQAFQNLAILQTKGGLGR